jgi:hypothetical protein
MLFHFSNLIKYLFLIYVYLTIFWSMIFIVKQFSLVYISAEAGTPEAWVSIKLNHHILEYIFVVTAMRPYLKFRVVLILPPSKIFSGCDHFTVHGV